MAWTYLALSIIGAGFTLNALRPSHRRVLAGASFAAGWITSELAVHHVAWEMAATALLGAFGALDEWPGWVGLGISCVSWFGLLALTARARHADRIMSGTLKGALGSDRLTRARSSRPASSPARSAREVILPLWLRDPGVEIIRDIDYAGDGARAHRLDIYRPRGPVEAAPVFLFIHGGAWVMGDKREQGRPLMLHLARRGWVCVTANYRLSPKVAFPAHLVDCKLALRWLRDNIGRYGGDPSWLAVGGDSAGGHLCSLLAFTPGDPAYQPGFETAHTAVDACVPFYGVYNFVEPKGAWARSLGRLLELGVMKVSADKDPTAYELASPLHRVTDSAPPFLVVHGRNDTLVPVEEARAFVKELERVSKGVVAYAELPEAQHAFAVFHSVRTRRVVEGVGDFLEAVREMAPRPTGRADPPWPAAPSPG